MPPRKADRQRETHEDRDVDREGAEDDEVHVGPSVTNGPGCAMHPGPHPSFY